MTIGEISEKYGISQDTLRYYEKVGMIPKVTRTKGGIRNYTEEDMKWLDLVVCLRSAGLPIAVMSEYIRLFREGDSTAGERLALLKQQREVLIGQRKKMDEMLCRLNDKIAAYETDVSAE